MIFIIFSFTHYLNSARGQSKGSWFSVGIDPSLVYKNSTNPFNYLNGLAQFSIQRNDNLFSIYINKIGRIDTIKPTKNKTYDEFDNALNFGLILGKIKIERYCYFSVSTGLSLLKGNIRQFNINPSSTNEKDFGTIGIPVEIQVGTSIRFIGLGIKLFTNLNLESPYSCLMLTLNYGNLLKNM